MIEGFLAGAGGIDEDLQVVLGLDLADVFLQGAQPRIFEAVVVAAKLTADQSLAHVDSLRSDRK
ncbi:MAG: hypothetical protein R2864_02045 [Syntrophotaleaceae bacterium]